MDSVSAGQLVLFAGAVLGNLRTLAVFREQSRRKMDVYPDQVAPIDNDVNCHRRRVPEGEGVVVTMSIAVTI